MTFDHSWTPDWDNLGDLRSVWRQGVKYGGDLQHLWPGLWLRRSGDTVGRDRRKIQQEDLLWQNQKTASVIAVLCLSCSENQPIKVAYFNIYLRFSLGANLLLLLRLLWIQSVMVHDLMSLCCVLVFLMSCFFALLCLLSSPLLLACLSPSLSVLFPSCFLLSVLLPPLSPPVPRSLISVSVYFCELFVSSLLVFEWCPPRVPCVFSCVSGLPFRYVLDFDFSFFLCLIWTLLFFVCTLFCCYSCSFVFWSLEFSIVSLVLVLV